MTDSLARHYSVVVDFLGQTLGPDYEISLHDLRTGSIIAIANGRISGRNTGSPISEMTQRLLEQKEYETSDYVLHYTSQLANGTKVRSSTMFIKDDMGTPVGVLCINFDDSRFLNLYSGALRMLHPPEYGNLYCSLFDAVTPQVTQEIHPSPAVSSPSAPPPPDPEYLYNDVTAMIRQIFSEVANGLSVPPDRLTQAERIAFVAQLHERGLFRLKGAIQYAQEQMGCSQASMYRYLTKAKANLS